MRATFCRSARRNHFALPDDKQWLTAAEAADAALPSFDFTERQIRRFLVDGQIKSRRRSGRGGGREFHWSDLPPQARAEWLKRHALPNAAVTAADNTPTCRAAARDLTAEARILIVEAVEHFLAARAVTKAKGLKSFSAAYQNRRIKLDDWVFRAVAAVEPHQLRTWSRLARSGGVAALIDKRGRPKGTGLFDTDMPLRNYAIAQIAARPHLSATHLQSAIAVDLKREIPLRTVQAFAASLRDDNKALLKALNNPDAWRSHHQPAFGSLSRQIERINQRWEIDASPADAMCLVDGKPRRMKLTACIDVFTRRARVLVSDQPRAVATMALLARCVRDFGLPEELKADNGKEFKSRSMQAFCRDLSIGMNFSRAFTPEEKGHIERFFRTLQHDLFEALPGYLGHNVAQRQAIENRKSFAHRFGEDADLAFGVELTPEGLQARIDAWLSDIYEQRVHGKLGMPPFAKALAHAADAKKLQNERLLDTLLLSAPGNGGLRIVAKKGIALFNRVYVSEELGFYAGTQVSVRYDAHDPARIVVYSADGATFLCVAVDPTTISNRDLAQLAIKAKRNARSVASDMRAATRKVLKLFPADGMADRRLEAASGGIALTDDSADMMVAAHPPRLIEQRAALDAQECGPQAIEATAEQREGATAFLDELRAKSEAPAPRMTQCDGYERPAFEGDEVGFWNWALANIDTLDDTDMKSLEAMRADRLFQQILAIETARAARITA